MTEIVCTGLDGGNPLHMLASLGLLRAGHDRHLVTAMSWRFDAQWRPVFAVNDGPNTFWEAMCDAIAPRRLWRARRRLEAYAVDLRDAEAATTLAKSMVETAKATKNRMAIKSARDRRSYALQFNDPQDDTRSQVAVNCLAFIGLACLPVVPLARRPATVGFGSFPTASGASNPGGTDENENGPR